MSLFSKKVSKPMSLQDVIKLQDTQARIFQHTEAERQQAQMKTAQRLLSEIRPLLDPRITLDINSEIRQEPVGAMTHLVFRVPGDLDAAISAKVRIVSGGVIRSEIYTETNSNHQRMLEDLAYVVRGLRDICKQAA